MTVSSAPPPLSLAPALPVDKLSAASPYQSAPLPIDPVLLGAGIGIAARSIVRAVKGWKRYPGHAQDICRAVIEDCWTGEAFAGSAGHFRQFWTRDLAMCTPALGRLGFRDRVIASWDWGLARFERAGRLTTTLFNRRFARDVYAYACDSLPLTLFALHQIDAEHLITRHRRLLSKEIARFERTVFDRETGMARTEGYFSGPRDCLTGRSTVFANSMIGLLARLLPEHPQLPNPFAGLDIESTMRRQFWTGDYFRDSLCRDVPSGDANVWPFFVGLFPDPRMRRRAFATLESRGFTSPIPLRYFERRLPHSELPVPRFFTPNYQGDPSWTQLGPLYLALLADVDRPLMESHRANMAALIERDQNYLELYTHDARPYQGRAALYHADEGMIWAALFLDLYR